MEYYYANILINSIALFTNLICLAAIIYLAFKLRLFIISISKKLEKKRNTKKRSAHELTMRAQGLSELAEIIKSFDCDWHVSGGTALGVAREKDFIPWDWDVGIAVKAEQFKDIWPSFVQKVQKEGFEVFQLRTFALENNEKILLKKYDQNYEILFWTKKGDKRVRKIFCRSSKFFDKTEMRKLRGKYYPFPSPLEEYLEEVYGDWRTPIRDGDKKKYFNPAGLMK